MAKRRKTFEVEKIREWANLQMARPEMSQEFKKGIFSLTEQILYESGNYRGFNYIYWLERGCDEWRAAGEPKDNSEYRGNEYDRMFYR